MPSIPWIRPVEAAQSQRRGLKSTGMQVEILPVPARPADRGRGAAEAVCSAARTAGLPLEMVVVEDDVEVALGPLDHRRSWKLLVLSTLAAK